MASDKIRLGVIGANIHRGWAPRSHLPAAGASPEFELTAVATTRQETAEESAKKFGARMAFGSYQELLACPEVDAVAVVLRVPSHYQVTKDAINAGKHVYTEWPLGATLDEAQELASLAKAKGVQTAVGLQARLAPSIMHMKGLVESGYIGDVMSCQVTLIRGGILERGSDRTWMKDDALGATTLTIAFGHTVDALRFVVGEFSSLSAVVSTQAKQWRETDTKKLVDVTAPDHILVSGKLASGAVASVHVAAVPWMGSGYRMEVYGSKGTLVATSEDSPQLKEVRLQGAQAGERRLKDLPAPDRHVYVLEGMPKGEPYNVGQMYYKFAQAIRSGKSDLPDFDLAVNLHQFLDGVRQSSDQGREVTFG
ncbi:MAG: Gfo/Idh/MocA family oxidoreductase [SAR202 cluster bacterium]|nr:Gfo/Idh/MocA family oxidoreductase [SAR202 cluster bacterium]